MVCLVFCTPTTKIYKGPSRIKDIFFYEIMSHNFLTPSLPPLRQGRLIFRMEDFWRAILVESVGR